MHLLYSLLLVLIMTTIQAQDPVIFIYDASGSMWANMGEVTKVEIAREVMVKTVDHVSKDRAIGLVAYGHRHKGDCDDVEEVVPVDGDMHETVKSRIAGIDPLGKTPLAASAEVTIERLKTNGLKATIILLTDGVESCGGDLCDVVKKAREAGIVFKLHIVGFDIDPREIGPLKCAAEAGGGQYFDARDEEGLYAVMEEAVKQTLDRRSGNFSVSLTKNGEGVDGWVRVFDPASGEELMGRRTYGDSAYLDLPPGNYILDLKPLEGSSLRSRREEVTRSDTVSRHETYAFDAGSLLVTTTKNGEGWDASVKVKDRNGAWVDGARTYGRTTQLELDPGTYMVEIEVLKIEGEGVKRTSEIRIKPGEEVRLQEDFSSGVLKVGMSAGEELVDAIVKIKDLQGNEVASGRTYTSEQSNPKTFHLIQGRYKAEIKGLKSHNDKNEVLEVIIESGKEYVKMIRY
jgi:Ca-activated chloride channel family protein